MQTLSFFNKIKNKAKLHWIVFLLLLIYAIIGLLHHDFWRDETQAWNIVLDSNSIATLRHNIRYEGHPMGWFLVLYCIKLLGGTLQTAAWLHLIIELASAYLILFKIKANIFVKIAIIFSYVFGIEYMLYVRNYNIPIFLFLIFYTLLCSENNKRKYFQLFLVLSVAMQFNAFASIFALCLAVFPLWDFIENFRQLSKKEKQSFLLGAGLLFLSTLCFVFTVLPPADAPNYSASNTLASLYRDSLTYWEALPLLGDLSYLTLAREQSVNHPLISVTLNILPRILIIIYLFSIGLKSKKVLFFNLGFIIGILAMNAIGGYIAVDARHTGILFLLVFFSVNYIKNREGKDAKWARFIFYFGLCLQFYLGIRMYQKQISLPESNSQNAGQYLKNNYPKALLACFPEYLSAPLAYYTDKEIYVLSRDSFMNYSVWDSANDVNKPKPSSTFLKKKLDEAALKFPNQKIAFCSGEKMSADTLGLTLVQTFDMPTPDYRRNENYYIYTK